MTIAEVNALLYTPPHSRSQLERAVLIPALSAGWRSSFEVLLDRERSGSAVTGKGIWPGMAASIGRSLYTRSTHTGIGKTSSVEAISAMGNSGRISPSMGWPMARFASGIDIASGVPSLK